MAATTEKLVLPRVDHKLWAQDSAAAYQKWEALFLTFLADLEVKDITAACSILSTGKETLWGHSEGPMVVLWDSLDEKTKEEVMADLLARTWFLEKPF
jgi:hypothetical protein